MLFKLEYLDNFIAFCLSGGFLAWMFYSQIQYLRSVRKHTLEMEAESQRRHEEHLEFMRKSQERTRETEQRIQDSEARIRQLQEFRAQSEQQGRDDMALMMSIAKERGRKRRALEEHKRKVTQQMIRNGMNWRLGRPSSTVDPRIAWVSKQTTPHD